MTGPPAAPGGEAVPGVVVVGAGLAGLVAALRLGEQQVPVEVYEASGRPGGKSGSDLRGGEAIPPYLSDHGYHVFPAWYTNTWRLIGELGVRDRFQDRKPFWRLRRHRAQRLRRDGLRLWRTSHRLAIIWPRTLLAAYDLVARDEAEIGDVSLEDFLQGLDYRGARTGDELRDICLKGLGNPPEKASARTLRANMALLLPVLFRRPNWTAARGSLQEVFIDPLAARVRDHARLHRNTGVVALDATGSGPDFTVRALTLADGTRIDLDGRPVVLAVPHGVVDALLAPHRGRVPDALAHLGELESRPMAAVDIHLRDRLRGFPTKGHVILDGTPRHLTALDIRPVWDDEQLPGTGTVLQVIAADIEGDADLPDVGRAIVDEVLEFLPFLDRDRDVLGWITHDNREVPLFMNTAGKDRFRPPSDRFHGTNLLVAGDWCDTPISLACMEGAVVSGTQAAACVLATHGLDAPELTLPSPDTGAWARRIVRRWGWLLSRLPR